ncbi:MAG TPA: hypothetical protein GXZ82_09755 [Firmicutes bacterium]|nr:hypothetical protein [Bacillota bacterium]
MEIDIKHNIVAAITMHTQKVEGGVPIFYVKDKEELVKVATYIAKATLGMVHDLDNGTYIVVKH